MGLEVGPKSSSSEEECIPIFLYSGVPQFCILENIIHIADRKLYHCFFPEEDETSFLWCYRLINQKTFFWSGSSEERRVHVISLELFECLFAFFSPSECLGL